MAIDKYMKQATCTAAYYLDSAIKDIDQRFGKGAAKKEPALIAAYMNAAALDYSASVRALEGDNVAAKGMYAIASAIETIDFGPAKGLKEEED
jgi:hypothetical protein